MSKTPEAIGWRIIIKPIETVKITKGGIHVPLDNLESQEMLTVVGEIVSVGPQAWTRNDMGGAWAKIGDFVLYGKYSGAKFKYLGEKYIVLNDDEIMAKVGDPDAVRQFM